MFQNANNNQPSLYNLSFLLPPDWKSKKGSMSLSPRHPHMRWEGTVRIKSVKKRGVRAPYKEVRWKIRPREERPEQMHLGTNYFPHHCHQELDFWLFGCILRICFGQVTGSLPSSPQPLPFAKCNHLPDDSHLVKTFNAIEQRLNIFRHPMSPDVLERCPRMTTNVTGWLSKAASRPGVTSQWWTVAIMTFVSYRRGSAQPRAKLHCTEKGAQGSRQEETVFVCGS